MPPNRLPGPERGTRPVDSGTLNRQQTQAPRHHGLQQHAEGVGAEPYKRESNVPQGGVEELVAHKLYRVICFDIASGKLDKPGMLDGLGAIALILLRDAAPYVEVTGLESKSIRSGSEFSYGWARAESVALFFEACFRQDGRNLRCRRNSLGPIGVAAPGSPPFVKAMWRAASIKMRLSGRPYSAPGTPMNPDMGLPPRPDWSKSDADVREFVTDLLKDQLKSKLRSEVIEKVVEGADPFVDIVEFQIEAFNALAEANQLGDRNAFRLWFWQGYDKALSDLRRGYTPSTLDKYLHFPRPYHLSQQLERIEGHVTSHGMIAYNRLHDRIFDYGRYAAAAYVASMDRLTFEEWRTSGSGK